MYHRVVELREYASPLAVTPANFERHMECLRERCRPLHLSELGPAMRRNRIPKRSVVVTLDDGYVDNLRHAKPILEQHGIPATIFVSSGAVDDDKGFWWDEVDSILLSHADPSRTLRLTIAGRPHAWVLGGAAETMQVRRELNALIRPLPSAEREQVLEHLREWAGRRPDVDPLRRAMTADELREIARSSHLELGGHTRSHPMLSLLSHEQQLEEIVGGRRALEGIVGAPIKTFAYPYGDFSSLSAEIVRAAGFDLACTTQAGLVEARTDTVRLPRHWVGDWSGVAFEEYLERALAS